MSHLPKSVFKTSRIAALGTRLSCSTNTICRSQLQSSGLTHAWARYGIGVHCAHVQLNRFSIEFTFCITCVTSRTMPSSCFIACNIKKLGDRAWGRGYLIIPTTLVCTPFYSAIPTSPFNFIQLCLMLVTVPFFASLG